MQDSIDTIVITCIEREGSIEREELGDSTIDIEDKGTQKPSKTEKREEGKSV